MRNILRYLNILTFILATIPAQANTLQENRKIFDFVGTRIEFFEHKYGPHMNRVKQTYYYDIGGCAFKIFLTKNRTIKYIQMVISDTCDITPRYKNMPQVSKIFAQDFYNEVVDIEFVKPMCVTTCPPYYEPSIIILVHNSHAEAFVTNILTVNLTNETRGGLINKFGKIGIINRSYRINDYRDELKKLIREEKIIEYGEGFSLVTKDIIQDQPD